VPEKFLWVVACVNRERIIESVYTISEQLTGVWQWDVADQSEACSKNWNKNDQMDICVSFERKKVKGRSYRTVGIGTSWIGDQEW